MLIEITISSSPALVAREVIFYDVDIAALRLASYHGQIKEWWLHILLESR